MLAFLSVDLGSIPLLSHTESLKMVFSDSLLDAWQERNIVGRKLSRSLVVSLRRASGGNPPSLSDRQM